MRTLVHLLLLAALGYSRTQGKVISEPDDVTVCEGREAVFTCVLSSSIRSDDVQWYRFIKDTSTTVMVDLGKENFNFTIDPEENDDENATNSSLVLTITDVAKSYTGYFWVGMPSLNVCNASLTVLAAEFSEPDDVTVCEGREAVFTCVLNSSIRSDDVQWYRLLKDTSTTVMVTPNNENIYLITNATGCENATSSSLTITNVIKSYTGYFWAGTPSLNVCNASLTVLTRPPALKVNIMTNIESSSIVVQWNKVKDSRITSYLITWYSSSVQLVTKRLSSDQASYTITGLTLNTVYTIHAFAQNNCGSGPKFTTSIILSTTTTSTTSSISPTVTTSTNPMATMSANATIVNPNTNSTNSIYTSTTPPYSMSPSATSTNSMNPSTTSDSINSSATSTNSMIITSIDTDVRTTTTAVSSFIITISTDTLLLSTSPAKTTMADNNSDSSNIPIIAGAALGGFIVITIVIVLILVIIFCCLQQRKDIEKNNYNDLSGDDTLAKDIPVALNPLNANDKPEAESSHQISTTTEVLYMTSDMGNKKLTPYKPTESAPQNARSKLFFTGTANNKSESTGRKDTQHQQFMEYAEIDIDNKKIEDKQQNGGAGTQHQQPMEYAVVDKSKKKNRKGDKQQNADDEAVSSSIDHANANQNKINPMLHYADLEVLPPGTAFVTTDESRTPYALVAET